MYGVGGGWGQAAMGDMMTRFTADTTGLQAGVARANQAINNFAANMVKAGGALYGTNHLLESMAQAWAAPIIDATNRAIDFQHQLNEISSVMGRDGVNGAVRYRRELLDLAQTMGVDLKDATETLYQALSAGIPKDNVVDFLKASANAARAGITNLESASQALRTIIKAYSIDLNNADNNLSKIGKTAEGAASSLDTMNRINDVLLNAMAQGGVRYSELANNIGKVASVAAETGVNLEELTAMLAVSTRQLNSAEFASGLQNLMRTFTRPTPAAMAAIESMNIKLGLFGANAIQLNKKWMDAHGGFTKSLRLVNDLITHNTNKLGSAQEVWQDLTQRQQGAREVTVLLANDGRDLDEVLKEQTKSLGTQARMAGQMTDAWQKLKTAGNQVRTLLTQVGTIDLGNEGPVIKGLTHLNNLLKGVSAKLENAPQLRSYFMMGAGGAAVATTGLVIFSGVLGRLMISLSLFKYQLQSILGGSFGAFGKAFLGGANPLNAFSSMKKSFMEGYGKEGPLKLGETTIKVADEATLALHEKLRLLRAIGATYNSKLEDLTKTAQYRYEELWKVVEVERASLEGQAKALSKSMDKMVMSVRDTGMKIDFALQDLAVRAQNNVTAILNPNTWNNATKKLANLLKTDLLDRLSDVDVQMARLNDTAFEMQISTKMTGAEVEKFSEDLARQIGRVKEASAAYRVTAKEVLDLGIGLDKMAASMGDVNKLSPHLGSVAKIAEELQAAELELANLLDAAKTLPIKTLGYTSDAYAAKKSAAEFALESVNARILEVTGKISILNERIGEIGKTLLPSYVESTTRISDILAAVGRGAESTITMIVENFQKFGMEALDGLFKFNLWLAALEAAGRAAKSMFYWFKAWYDTESHFTAMSKQVQEIGQKLEMYFGKKAAQDYVVKITAELDEQKIAAAEQRIVGLKLMWSEFTDHWALRVGGLLASTLVRAVGYTAAALFKIGEYIWTTLIPNIVEGLISILPTITDKLLGTTAGDFVRSILPSPETIKSITTEFKDLAGVFGTLSNGMTMLTEDAAGFFEGDAFKQFLDRSFGASAETTKLQNQMIDLIKKQSSLQTEISDQTAAAQKKIQDVAALNIDLIKSATGIDESILTALGAVPEKMAELGKKSGDAYITATKQGVEEKIPELKASIDAGTEYATAAAERAAVDKGQAWANAYVSSIRLGLRGIGIMLGFPEGLTNAAANYIGGAVSPFIEDAVNKPSEAPMDTTSYYATGTKGATKRGGWAWVGEHGKELAYLPAGSRVLSAGNSARVAGRFGRIPGYAAGTTDDLADSDFASISSDAEIARLRRENDRWELQRKQWDRLILDHRLSGADPNSNEERLFQHRYDIWKAMYDRWLIYADKRMRQYENYNSPTLPVSGPAVQGKRRPWNPSIAPEHNWMTPNEAGRVYDKSPLDDPNRHWDLANTFPAPYQAPQYAYSPSSGTQEKSYDSAADTSGSSDMVGGIGPAAGVDLSGETYTNKQRALLVKSGDEWEKQYNAWVALMEQQRAQMFSMADGSKASVSEVQKRKSDEVSRLTRQLAAANGDKLTAQNIEAYRQEAIRLIQMKYDAPLTEEVYQASTGAPPRMVTQADADALKKSGYGGSFSANQKLRDLIDQYGPEIQQIYSQLSPQQQEEINSYKTPQGLYQAYTTMLKSAGFDTSEGGFANQQKLDALEKMYGGTLDQAFNRLSPEQQDYYLRTSKTPSGKFKNDQALLKTVGIDPARALKQAEGGYDSANNFSAQKAYEQFNNRYGRILDIAYANLSDEEKAQFDQQASQSMSARLAANKQLLAYAAPGLLEQFINENMNQIKWMFPRLTKQQQAQYNKANNPADRLLMLMDMLGMGGSGKLGASPLNIYGELPPVPGPMTVQPGGFGDITIDRFGASASYSVPNEEEMKKGGAVVGTTNGQITSFKGDPLAMSKNFKSVNAKSTFAPAVPIYQQMQEILKRAGALPSSGNPMDSGLMYHKYQPTDKNGKAIGSAQYDITSMPKGLSKADALQLARLQDDLMRILAASLAEEKKFRGPQTINVGAGTGEPTSVPPVVTEPGGTFYDLNTKTGKVTTKTVKGDSFAAQASLYAFIQKHKANIVAAWNKLTPEQQQLFYQSAKNSSTTLASLKALLKMFGYSTSDVRAAGVTKDQASTVGTLLHDTLNADPTAVGAIPDSGSPSIDNPTLGESIAAAIKAPITAAGNAVAGTNVPFVTAVGAGTRYPGVSMAITPTPAAAPSSTGVTGPPQMTGVTPDSNRALVTATQNEFNKGTTPGGTSMGVFTKIGANGLPIPRSIPTEQVVVGPDGKVIGHPGDLTNRGILGTGVNGRGPTQVPIETVKGNRVKTQNVPLYWLPEEMRSGNAKGITSDFFKWFWFLDDASRYNILVNLVGKDHADHLDFTNSPYAMAMFVYNQLRKGNILEASRYKYLASHIFDISKKADGTYNNPHDVKELARVKKVTYHDEFTGNGLERKKVRDAFVAPDSYTLADGTVVAIDPTSPIPGNLDANGNPPDPKNIKPMNSNSAAGGGGSPAASKLIGGSNANPLLNALVNTSDSSYLNMVPRSSAKPIAVSGAEAGAARASGNVKSSTGSAVYISMNIANIRSDEQIRLLATEAIEKAKRAEFRSRH